MDRGAWRATVHGVVKASDMTEHAHQQEFFFSNMLKGKVPTEGLPWWSSGYEFTFQCRGHGFDPWSGN